MISKTAKSSNVKSAHDALVRVFGLQQFRGDQEAIIAQVLAGGDAFVLMPTGGGKSLCYQIPAILREGAGVVISPLIALMRDQTLALQQNGIRAEMLNSSMSTAEQARVVNLLKCNELDLLYLAPERLLEETTWKILGQSKIALYAIDEAHCVSRWGHDFREEYLQLGALQMRFPNVPRMALTATADQTTRKEIISCLGLESARIFVTGFDRPNIRYQIVVKDNPREQLKVFLNNWHPKDSGIVYCLSRKKAEETADWLSSMGRNAYAYHAGMTAELRRKNQDLFLQEDNIIIVATIAFGMGIDKPDVRFVAHLDLPKNIEAYYQETGRAGRDGLPADAWMAYGMSDVVQLRRFIEDSEADDNHKRMEFHKLDLLLALCETADCRRKGLLRYLGDNWQSPCGNCDNCLQAPETWDATLASRKALYLVKQTGERFGARYLTDILLGVQTDRVTRFGHDGLSAFGKGVELNEYEWSTLFRQLVCLGYLQVDPAKHWGIQLTSLSDTILRNTTPLLMRRYPTPTKETRKRKRKSREPVPETSAENSGLFEALKSKRLELARQLEVPAFVIFPDSVLKRMASDRPGSLDELSNILGVGDYKLRTFGQGFLAIIQEHSED